MVPDPCNVGVLAIEVYIPENYVCQADLEVYDDVTEGKYTKGLGQVDLAFCGEDEDVVSMALTALHRLLTKYSIDPRHIGRLEVGTESSPDRSKSVKSYLMQLFTPSSNFCVQGGDSTHACFGSTAAVLAAADWIEGRAWDGRLAVVVATDAAVYPPGAARASGGAGAAAMLIGPDAPLAINRECSALHFEHSFDFYKPAGSHYPQWDGLQSLDSYLRLLRLCYHAFCNRQDSLNSAQHSADPAEQASCSLQNIDHVVVHAPFNRLVQKALLTLEDVDRLRRDVASGVQGAAERLVAAAAPGQPCRIRLSGRQCDMEKVQAGMHLAQHTGNTYTASLWCGLASLVAKGGQDLEGSKVLMYSYGSGAVGCLFALRGRRCDHLQFNLQNLKRQLQIPEQLAKRHQKSPEEFSAASALAEVRWNQGGWAPGDPLSTPSLPHTERSRPDSHPADTSHDRIASGPHLELPTADGRLNSHTQSGNGATDVYKLAFVDARHCRFYTNAGQ